MASKKAAPVECPESPTVAAVELMRVFRDHAQSMRARGVVRVMVGLGDVVLECEYGDTEFQGELH